MQPSASQRILLSLYSGSFLLAYIYFWVPLMLPGWGQTAWFIPILTFVALPILDQVVGDYQRNPSAAEESWLTTQNWMRGLPILALPVYLLYQVTIGQRFLAADTLSAQLGWLLTAGIGGTTLAINIGHELIHRRSKAEQRVGGVLLAAVCYGGFKIEHIYGHHVKVATSDDLTTAPKGMSLYRFWLRTLTRTPIDAFRLAQQRARKRNGLNEAVVLALVSLSFLIAYSVWQGWAGALYFLAQSLIAILLLETVNYIEHYGLLRKKREGRWEAITHHHSWNSSKTLTNSLLFNLQRHSDHHAHASRPYYLLRHFDDAPQLPFGYAAMIVVSLVPPIWFRVMEKQLKNWSAEG